MLDRQAEILAKLDELLSEQRATRVAVDRLSETMTATRNDVQTLGVELKQTRIAVLASEHRIHQLEGQPPHGRRVKTAVAK